MGTNDGRRPEPGLLYFFIVAAGVIAAAFVVFMMIRQASGLLS